jgi:FkbM family methyltransferase
MNDFYKGISLAIAEAIDNFYPDNFDFEIRRLGYMQRATVSVEKLCNSLLKLLKKNILVSFRHKNNFYFKNIELFANTFYLLSDSESQRKFIELLAYKMLGFTKVKLSLNTDNFLVSRQEIEKYKKPETIPVNFRNGYLNLYDLSTAGYNLKLYFISNGILVDFIMQQYNYSDLVYVKPGDVVIDAGGCWGDTALYFAAKGAVNVFVYEFIPSNIEIFKQNISLNPHYEKNITLIEKAVWETSCVNLSFDDRGPASRVGEFSQYPSTTQTLSIDDLVASENLSRVDFIKMDIEGAELSALKGAYKTIKRFKPKLAISVYHKLDDMIIIPEYIHSLNPDYQFYLDYYTIIGDEVVLYAVNNNAE